MSIIHVTGEGGQVVIERNPFYGTKIPNSISKMLKFLPQVHYTLFRSCLQVVMRNLTGDVRNINHLLTERGSKGLNVEEVEWLYSGLYCLVRLVLKHSADKLKPEMVKEDLKIMNFPAEFINEIIIFVFNEELRATINSFQKSQIPATSKQFESAEFKINVTISSSALERVLEPIVQMKIKFQDQSSQQFEIPISKFHELRYKVADGLQAVQSLKETLS